MTYNLALDQSKLKSISSNLRERVNATEGDISSAQMLQMLSQSIFSKPYEELKNSILSESDKVYVVYSSSISVVVSKGKIVLIVTPENIKKMNIKERIFRETKIKDEENIIYISIPDLDDKGNLNTEYAQSSGMAMKIAKKMGYLKKTPSIFDEIEMAKVIIVDHQVNSYTLDGEWMSEMENEDSIIWEINICEQGVNREYYVSFKELCEATLEDDGKWLLASSGQLLTVRFY